MLPVAIEPPRASAPRSARSRPALPQVLLGSLAVLLDAPREALARLGASSSMIELARGEWLFRAGERCAGLHAVARGSVKLAFFSSAGAEKVLEIVRPGQSFGEWLLFLDQPCLVSARALSSSTLLHVPLRALEAELAREPRLALGLLGGLSRRLQALLEDAGSNALRSGAERLVDYLLRAVASLPPGNGTPEIALPRKGALASRLDMTPEHFSRTLHKLAALELIEVAGRQVRVPDAERLRAWRG